MRVRSISKRVTYDRNWNPDYVWDDILEFLVEQGIKIEKCSVNNSVKLLSHMLKGQKFMYDETMTVSG